MSLSSLAIRPRSVAARAWRATRAVPRPAVPGWVVLPLLAGLVGVLLLTQGHTLAGSLDTLRTADPVWVGLGASLVALRYVMGAVSLVAAVPGPLPLWPTIQVQLASAFVGRFTPEGLGWLVLNQRYLERAGLDRGLALAAISLKVLAAGAMRLATAVVVAVLAGAQGALLVELPALPGPLVAATLAIVAFVVLALGAALRSRGTPRWAAGLAPLRTVLRSPRRMAALLVSSGLLTVLTGFALVTSTLAVGAGVSPVGVLGVYLVGTAIAAASPTPGNLGAVEVALTAGLTALGSTPSAALAAVLLYRLLTFWLPALPGAVSVRSLRARGAL